MRFDMPKRVVDGEAIWQSDKLSQVSEQWRGEYANLLPLAYANGTFECNPRLIWSKVYSYNRPNVTVDDVASILDQFEEAKMLFRWFDENGKCFGYFVGIDKSGRLPLPSRDGMDRKGP